MMSHRNNRLAIWLLVAGLGRFLLSAAPGYLPTPDLNDRLREISLRRPDLVRLEVLCRTPHGREVLLVELGTLENPQRKEEPAMLAVGGLEGNDLCGSSSLTHWAEELVGRYDTDPQVRELLNRSTIYVVPRLNADSAELFFASPRRESTVNLTPADDDHDGFLDEDGPEDLDGNGEITSMRIKDPEGEFIRDPVDPRLMMKADRAKGERGEWRLLLEGLDNDADDRWNEDGPGGVNLNRNFPHGYEYFAPDAGAHPLSDAVSRALADFVIARPHIGIFFSFSSADMLTKTPKAESPKLPPVTIDPEDLGFFRQLGKEWRDTLGLRKEVEGEIQPGTFAAWAYFHRGRFALEARAWSPTLQLESGKAPNREQTGSGETNKQAEATSTGGAKEPPSQAVARQEDAADKRNDVERAFLRWIDTNAPTMFVAWKKFEHPDFEGKEVEIGGFKPFARSNPPENLLPTVVEQHSRFLTALAGKLPRLTIRSAKSKPLGDDVYEVVIQVENTGYLPTSLSHGIVTREVHPTRVEVGLPDTQILGGTRRTSLNSIPGLGGMREVRLVLHANGQRHVSFFVTSALGGSLRDHIILK